MTAADTKILAEAVRAQQAATAVVEALLRLNRRG